MNYEEIIKDIRAAIGGVRNAIIEECAKTAEQAPLGTMPIDIARAIRALKNES